MDTLATLREAVARLLEEHAAHLDEQARLTFAAHPERLERELGRNEDWGNLSARDLALAQFQRSGRKPRGSQARGDRRRVKGVGDAKARSGWSRLWIG